MTSVVAFIFNLQWVVSAELNVPFSLSLLAGEPPPQKIK